MAERGRRQRRAGARQRVPAAPAPAAAARPPAPGWRLRWALAATFLGTLGVYVATLSHGIAGGDSGEMVTVTHALGVAHPPGYPLYTLLGKVFASIPGHEVAWRVNLFSAVAGAGAATLLCDAVARWSGRSWAGLGAAGLFAFSPRVWPYAVTAEVFALHNLVLAGLVDLTVRLEERPSRGLRLLGALWTGLGFANHYTVLLFAAPAVALAFVRGGAEVRRPREIAALAGCFLAGLLPYAYIPWASARVPLMSWGDQTTVDGFLTHLLRREYGLFNLLPDAQPGGFGERLAWYARGAWPDLAWVGPVLALAGAVWSVRFHASRLLGVTWMAAFVLYLVVFNGLANIPLASGVARAVQARFWQQPHLLLCAWAGLGLAWLAGRLPRAVATPGLAAAASALVAAQLLPHWKAQDRSRDDVFRQLARGILDALPPNAVLLEQGDHVFHGLRYVQIVEGHRPDVKVLDQLLLGYPWHLRLMRRHFPEVALPGTRFMPDGDRPGDYDLPAFLQANRGRFPLFTSGKIRGWDGARKTWRRWPMAGFVDRLMPAGESPEALSFIEEGRRNMARFDPRPLSAFPEDSWERLVLIQYWDSVADHGLALGRLAENPGGEHDEALLLRAAELVEEALRQAPASPVSLYKDLGAICQQLSGHRPEARGRMRWALGVYLERGPATDPDRVKIRQILAAP